MGSFKIGSLVAWHHPAEAKGPLRGRVLLVHGLGEHSARHHHTTEYLLKHGVEVVRFDLRGSGESSGLRQWVDRFSDYVEDVEAVRRWIAGQLPPQPLYLYGHSLGGAIAIHHAGSHPGVFQALLLSAPAYLVGNAVSPIKIRVGKVLAKWTPKLRIPESIDITSISREREVVESYRTDPLNTHYNTVRQGDEILKALEEIPELCRKITIPTLILHGGADRLILPEGSRAIFDALASKVKRLEIIPGAYHEVYNDLDKEKFFAVLGEFLKSI